MEETGVKVVKLNDKKAAKQNGILSVPGLTFYKGGKGSNFEGKDKGACLLDIALKEVTGWSF